MPTSRDEALVVLGLNVGASSEEINSAYYEILKKYHPDKVDHLGDEFKVIAEEKTKAINRAYNLLTTSNANHLQQAPKSGQSTDTWNDLEDELFAPALEIITDMGRASTSVLQRRLSIGYGRAAKILDMMERRGFIGPSEGASKPRKVLQAAYDFRERLSQILEEKMK